MTQHQVSHLELIQGVVTRMAGNSFQTKAWAVVLVSALLGFGVDRESAGFAGIAVFPALVFWGLDAYYLRQERLFRRLYNAVRLGKTNAAIDAFTLDVSAADESTEGWKVPCWPKTLLASTIWPLHLCTIALATAVSLYLLLAESNGGTNGEENILQVLL